MSDEVLVPVSAQASDEVLVPVSDEVMERWLAFVLVELSVKALDVWLAAAWAAEALQPLAKVLVEG